MASTTFALEATPLFVTLLGEVSGPEAELSGLAWHRDSLLLLPQFPDRMTEPGLFAIDRDDIAAALADGTPVEPRRVAVDLAGVVESIEGYEGFEAIVVDGDVATLAVEVREAPTRMLGMLVQGRCVVDDDGRIVGIELMPSTLMHLPTPAAIANKAFEALVHTGDGVLALFELATPAFVDPPVATHVVGHGGPDVQMWTRPVAPLVGRWTDATSVDASGRFLVMNYVWPGDRAIVEDAADDALAREWGVGATHADSEGIERIVAFRVEDDAVRRLDEAPTWLALDAVGGPRNWEGIARWSGDAVVVVTDRFPGTLLAVVPLVVGPGPFGVPGSSSSPD